MGNGITMRRAAAKKTKKPVALYGRPSVALDKSGVRVVY